VPVLPVIGALPENKFNGILKFNVSYILFFGTVKVTGLKATPDVTADV
jgi:hypothetical protein